MLTRSSRSSMGWHVRLRTAMDVTCSCKLFPTSLHQVLPGKAWGWGRGETAHQAAQVDVLRMPCALGPDLQGLPGDHEAVEHLPSTGRGRPPRDQSPTLNTVAAAYCCECLACGTWNGEQTKQPDCQLNFHGLHLNSLLISGHRYYLRRWP